MTEMTSINVGAAICKARTQQGLSQRELGSMLSVTHVAVCLWENNTNEPRLRQFFQLRKVLNNFNL